MDNISNAVQGDEEVIYVDEDGNELHGEGFWGGAIYARGLYGSAIIARGYNGGYMRKKKQTMKKKKKKLMKRLKDNHHPKIHSQVHHLLGIKI